MAGSGNDTINGTAGNDVIDGLGGNDKLHGLDGNDQLTGNTGNDTLDPGFGNDHADGGAGNDRLVIDYSTFIEGYGFSSSDLQVDPDGGYRGNYYLDGNNRVDFTGIESFTVTGTDYRDTIHGGDGDDVVNAGGGNDLVYLGAGNDTADGGAGIDGLGKDYSQRSSGVTVNLQTGGVSNTGGDFKNFEYFASVIGSDNDDTFVSTTHRGNDNISGGDGDDHVSYFRGNDRFSGGAGTDLLSVDYSFYTGGHGLSVSSFVAETSGEGYHGTVYLDGDNRTDFDTTERLDITGTDYGDSIVAGDGDDKVSAGGGDDVVQTGKGEDKLDGGSGIDGVGRDFTNLDSDITIDLGKSSFTGASGTIKNFEYFAGVTGGAGDDTFISTASLSNDSVSGGAGDDQASFFAGNDGFSGGDGTDRATIDWSTVNGNRGIQSSLNNDSNGGYSGYYYLDNSHRLDFNTTEAFTITGTAFDDSIVTGSGNDTINAGAGWDVVSSGSGKDYLDGGAGIDGVGRDLNSAKDDIKVDLAAGKVSGFKGSIVNFEYFAGFTTGKGNDTLISTSAQANDSVDGGSGNDQLSVFAGNDSFTGGLGTDRLVIDWSKVTSTAGITMGNQDVDTNGGFRGYFYLDGQNRADYSSVEAFTVTGTARGDFIQSQSGNDTISGLGGNDVILVGSGKDVADGGKGLDGFGADYSASSKDITIDLDADKLTGASGSIKSFEYLYNVRGGKGDDTFTTTHDNANDFVTGGAGGDKMYVYAGNDRFDAGSGKDTLVVDWSKVDTDSGVQTGGPNLDPDNGGYKGYYYLDGANRVDYTGVEKFSITATNNDDQLIGAKGDDTLKGLDGRDSLSGASGDDKLYGGDGGDVLDGGAGKDRLEGGAGADSLTGGTGADTFVFGQDDFHKPGPTYADRITDFSHADKDKIDLSDIDANTGVAKDQAFTFIGDHAFTGAGQLAFHVIDGVTYLEGNWNDDKVADFTIRVDSTTTLVASDFIL